MSAARPRRRRGLRRQDDQEIYWEGVNSLSFEELQAAVCASTLTVVEYPLYGCTDFVWHRHARSPMHLRLSTHARTHSCAQTE